MKPTLLFLFSAVIAQLVHFSSQSAHYLTENMKFKVTLEITFKKFFDLPVPLIIVIIIIAIIIFIDCLLAYLMD